MTIFLPWHLAAGMCQGYIAGMQHGAEARVLPGDTGDEAGV